MGLQLDCIVMHNESPIRRDVVSVTASSSTGTRLNTAGVVRSRLLAPRRLKEVACGRTHGFTPPWGSRGLCYLAFGETSFKIAMSADPANRRVHRCARDMSS
jgi:hypothetical protein